PTPHWPGQVTPVRAPTAVPTQEWPARPVPSVHAETVTPRVAAPAALAPPPVQVTTPHVPPVDSDLIEEARRKVFVPSRGLIVLGILTLAGPALQGMPRGFPRFVDFLGFRHIVVSTVVGLLLIIGGARMGKLRNYEWAMAAGIAAILLLSS